MTSRCTSPLVRTGLLRARAGDARVVGGGAVPPPSPHRYSPLSLQHLAKSTAVPAAFGVPTLLSPYVVCPAVVCPAVVCPPVCAKRSFAPLYPDSAVRKVTTTTTTTIDWFDQLHEDEGLDLFFDDDGALDECLAEEDLGLALDDDVLLVQAAATTTTTTDETVAISRLIEATPDAAETHGDEVDVVKVVPASLIPSEEVLRAADRSDDSSDWDARLADLLDQHEDCRLSPDLFSDISPQNMSLGLQITMNKFGLDSWEMMEVFFGFMNAQGLVD